MGLFGPSREKWVEVGAFQGYPGASPIVVTPDGTGLVGTTADSGEDDLTERLRNRRTAIHRVTSAGVVVVYQGTGGIVALDGVGDVRVAIRGTLKEAGEGSDYHLLLSTDGGWTFEERGPIEVLSILEVIASSADEIVVHGARTLARTLDGGETWEALTPREDWDLVRERLRRDGRETEWSSKVPDDRLLLRVAIEGDVVRILTRARDPRGGTDIQLFRSENGGRSFRMQRMDLGPRLPGVPPPLASHLLRERGLLEVGPVVPGRHPGGEGGGDHPRRGAPSPRVAPSVPGGRLLLRRPDRLGEWDHPPLITS
jgi:hypothetical protein